MTRRTLLRYAGAFSALASRLWADKSAFDIRDYGSTGNKADDATPAIQKALDAAAAAGGGTVYIPAGEYTSG
jgi:polygalacturonase